MRQTPNTRVRGGHSDPLEIVAEQRLTRSVMRAPVAPVADRRFIRVDSRHSAAQAGHIHLGRLRLGQQRIEPAPQVLVIAATPAEIPNQLCGTDRRNQHTRHLPDNRIGRTESGDCARPKQDHGELQQAMDALPQDARGIVVQRGPQQIEPKTPYLGGRTPGGTPRVPGLGRGAGGFCGGGVGRGCFAHRMSPIENMSPVKVVFIGDVAGRVARTARPAPDANPDHPENETNSWSLPMTRTSFQTLAHILANPGARFHPAAYAAAWATAKEIHGHPIAPERFERMTPAHAIAATGTLPFDALRARIQARAAEIGITGPAPLILPDPAA